MKARLHPQSRRAERASTILLALVIMAIGTLGVLAWASLIRARAVDVDATGEALDRRIRYENSRAMGEAYAAYRMGASGTNNAVNTELSDAWGRLSLSQWTGTPLATEISTTGVNHASPVSLSSHVTELSFLVNDGLSDHTVAYSLRSESPLLTGDLFVAHAPASGSLAVTAPLHVQGRAILWAGGAPHSYTGLRAERYFLPLGGTVAVPNLAGASNLPDNLPRVPLTSGLTSGATPDYSGHRLVVENTTAAANSYLAKVQATSHVEVSGAVASGMTGDPVHSDGLGNVTLDLGSSGLGHVIVTGGTRLVLQGQPDAAAASNAGNLPPVVVVVRSSAILSSGVQLAGQTNGRGLILAMRQSGGATSFTVGATAAAQWRLLLELERTPAVFNLGTSGGLTIMGGISTDASVASAGAGNITLVRENVSDLRESLAYFASRLGWVDRRPLVIVNSAPLADVEIGGWEGDGYAPISDEAKAAQGAAAKAP